MHLESDEEVLCRDVTIGRINRRWLSLDIAFYHRDPQEWGGAVRAAEHDFALTEGVFLELGVQGILRRSASKAAPPSKFLPGMAWWNTTTWQADRMTYAEGIDPVDLHSLHAFALRYNRSLVTPPGEPARVVFIARTDEYYIRQIASRLARTANVGT